MLARHRRSEGQALVVVALAFVVLVGFAGFALDGSNAFAQRRRASNAADAASLAGARALIAVRADDGRGDAINEAVRSFLVDQNGIDAGRATWQASYVSRANPDLVIETVDDAEEPPSDAAGIRVDLSFTFDTYFMRVLGQRTLAVGVTSTSVFGPLIATTGEDLVPVGISDRALERLLDEGVMRLDIKGKIMDAYERLPPHRQDPDDIDDVITQDDLAHVSFSGEDYTLSNPNGCRNPHGDDNNISYWWCNGTDHNISTGHILPEADPNWGEPNSSMIERVSERPTALVPVYAEVSDGAGGVALEVVAFVAVTMEYDPSDKALTLTVRTDYVGAGAMTGSANAEETGAWAVNLKR